MARRRRRYDLPAGSNANSVSAADNYDRAKKFVEWLGRALPPYHTPAKMQFKPVHIIRERRLLELGHRKARPWKIFPSLLISPTREVVQTERYPFNGRGVCDGNRIVSNTSGAVISTEICGPHFVISGLKDYETIVFTLVLCGEALLPPAGHDSPEWISVLTNLGRLLFVNANSGIIEHSFQLPAHLFRFKKISWHKCMEEICVIGRSHPIHIDDVGTDQHQRPTAFTDYTFALAVFEILPLRFKGMVKIDKNHFSNVNNVMVINDVLITYASHPSRIAMYDFDHLWRNYCIQPYAQFELSDGMTVLDFNIVMETTAQVKKIFELKGNFESIDVGGLPYYALIEPKSPREPLRLRKLLDIDRTPHMQGVLRLLGPHEGCRLDLDFCTTNFHPDDSSRLLRFEGEHLACYELRSIPNSDDSEIRFIWKTALLPNYANRTTDTPWVNSGESSTSDGRSLSRFGRPVARHSAQSQDQTVGQNVVVRQIHCDGASMMTILCYYSTNCQYHRRTVYVEDEAEHWVSLLICLNSCTGQILRLVPLQNIDGRSFESFSLRSHTMERMDDFYVSVANDAQKTTVDIYRLEERGAKEWKNEVEKRSPSQYQPSDVALSRKERRQRKKAERRASQSDDVVT